MNKEKSGGAGKSSHAPRRSFRARREDGGERRGTGRSTFGGHGAPRRGGFSRGRSGGGGFSQGRGNKGRGAKKRTEFDVSQYINRNPVQVTEETYNPTHTFKDFGLDQSLVQAVAARGFESPSPIQDKTIPLMLAGKDVIGLANTGTGKTAAFLLPLMHRALHDKQLTTLILAPTRELALQINEELRTLGKGLGFYSAVCVGGAPMFKQIRDLRKHNHFIIGTPGRVLDLITQGKLPIDTVRAVVLDEADRMLDMGFIHDIRKIVGAVPREGRHTLFFSATMSREVEALVHDFLHNPETVSVIARETAASIAQDVVLYEHTTKFDTLVSLLSDARAYPRVLIFGAMKHSVEKLGTALAAAGIPATSIHGNKSQAQRNRALSAIKEGKVRVLVATDVAARGIHVDDVSHVINYDLPASREDYIHRIGRTGRGGKRGSALTFVERKNYQTHS